MVGAGDKVRIFFNPRAVDMRTGCSHFSQGVTMMKAIHNVGGRRIRKKALDVTMKETPAGS